MWNSKWDSYKILDVPEAVEQKLIDDAPENFDDLIFYDSFSSCDEPGEGQEKIELYDYQLDARDKWFLNDKKI